MTEENAVNNHTNEPQLTRESVKAGVGKIMNIPADQVEENESLVDQGLDSLRLVTLIEEWRTDGADIDFHAFLEADTLNEWYELLHI